MVAYFVVPTASVHNFIDTRERLERCLIKTGVFVLSSRPEKFVPLMSVFFNVLVCSFTARGDNVAALASVGTRRGLMTGFIRVNRVDRVGLDDVRFCRGYLRDGWAVVVISGWLRGRRLYSFLVQIFVPLYVGFTQRKATSIGENITSVCACSVSCPCES